MLGIRYEPIFSNAGFKLAVDIGINGTGGILIVAIEHPSHTVHAAQVAAAAAFCIFAMLVLIESSHLARTRIRQSICFHDLRCLGLSWEAIVASPSLLSVSDN